MLPARARPEGGEKEPVRETELCGTVPGQAGLMPAGSRLHAIPRISTSAPGQSPRTSTNSRAGL